MEGMYGVRVFQEGGMVWESRRVRNLEVGKGGFNEVEGRIRKGRRKGYDGEGDMRTLEQ